MRSALSWSVRDFAEELSSCGFTQISGPFGASDEAFDVAGALFETCRFERGLPPLSIIGDFVLPPLDGAETRDFQTLHFDFGLPLDPKVEGDVARYIALHIPADVTGVRAVTRLVPLAALLEFDSLSSELAFFARHGLRIDDAEIDINLQPGELLLFDNLALAHGRRGTRQPGELRQRAYGHRLQPAAQTKLRDDVLTAFKARLRHAPITNSPRDHQQRP